jgi:tRNA U34 2-thiouridine synthase MnmA/TrmU
MHLQCCTDCAHIKFTFLFKYVVELETAVSTTGQYIHLGPFFKLS